MPDPVSPDMPCADWTCTEISTTVGRTLLATDCTDPAGAADCVAVGTGSDNAFCTGPPLLLLPTR